MSNQRVTNQMVLCKKCGGPPFMSATLGFDPHVRKQYINGYMVNCLDCEHEAPAGKTEEEAEALWEKANA